MPARRKTTSDARRSDRRPRGLTARSVIASTLLGVHPPSLPVRALVASAALFGIADGTVRVAVSRMVQAGELEPDGDGYRLTGALLERQARQDRSRAGTTRRWRGTWRTAIVVADARSSSQRAELRAAMAALRLAELREGVWLRPDNLPADTALPARTVVDGQCRWLVSRVDDPVALAADLWDLDGWATRATRLRSDLDRLLPRLEAGDTDVLADGFVLAAEVLRHFQSDPLLPDDLLPDGWPGDDLRRCYDRYSAAFSATIRRWNQTGGADVPRHVR